MLMILNELHSSFIIHSFILSRNVMSIKPVYIKTINAPDPAAQSSPTHPLSPNPVISAPPFPCCVVDPVSVGVASTPNPPRHPSIDTVEDPNNPVAAGATLLKKKAPSLPTTFPGGKYSQTTNQPCAFSNRPFSSSG